MCPLFEPCPIDSNVKKFFLGRPANTPDVVADAAAAAAARHGTEVYLVAHCDGSIRATARPVPVQVPVPVAAPDDVPSVVQGFLPVPVQVEDQSPVDEPVEGDSMASDGAELSGPGYAPTCITGASAAAAACDEGNPETVSGFSLW